MNPSWTNLVADVADVPLRWLTSEELDACTFGQVLKPETVNHKTLECTPGGLFDESIFGRFDEVHDGRFGRIDLGIDVLHPLWKTRWLSDLIDATGWSERQVLEILECKLWVDDDSQFVATESTPGTVSGAAAIRARLEQQSQPTTCIIREILVLPASLRPLVKAPDGRWLSSHINHLYRRVINRTNRLRRLGELNAPEIIIINEQRMTQEAVEGLFDNEHENVKTLNFESEPFCSLMGLVAHLDTLTGGTSAGINDTDPAPATRRALGALTTMGFTTA